jgi:hypothetical protein
MVRGFFLLGPPKWVPREDGARIQSPTRRVLKEKGDMVNVQNWNGCISDYLLPGSSRPKSMPNKEPMEALGKPSHDFLLPLVICLAYSRP